MRSNTSRARRVSTTSRVEGSIRSYSRSFLTAAMKASVMATLKLKLVNRVWSCLATMKSRMSGWSTRSTPMLAPRRLPPCLMVSVAASNTCMNDSGPEATPWVDCTAEFFGRSRENE